MNKFVPFALLATLATFSVAPVAAYAESSQSVRAATDEVAAPVKVNAGKMIYGGNGQRIAAVYRVAQDGTVQVILEGKLVNIPASTLSEVNGKVATSLTKQELIRAR
ncbi:MAG: hypothetical protein WCY11_16380 [Novosphingobium sp.]